MNEARHIIVPIDLHGINRGTLKTLVRIARQLDRGLLALLLEDIRLQQVADLPFTTEITLSGARERSLVRDHLSQRHSLVTSDTRRQLTDLAQRNHVELSFENAAGHRLHSVLQRNDHLDIFFPARQRWQLLSTRSPVASSAISRLGVVLPRTEQAGHVVEVASGLLTAGLVSEMYILSDHSPPSGLLQILYRPGHRICVQSNLEMTPIAISRLIRQSPYDLLLLPRDSLAEIPPAALDAALEKAGGQVLAIN